MPYSKKLKNNWIVIISLIGCLLSGFIFTSFILQGSTVQKYALANSYTREQIVYIVNQERIKQNLPRLRVNEKLMISSDKKAKDMADKNYFSHFSPIDNKKWSDFIKEEGYNYVVAGENLANGFDSVDKMVDAWMKSTSHKENILNKDVDETGVGIIYGKLDNKPTIFVVQEFGKLAEEKVDSNHNKPLILDTQDLGSLQKIMSFPQKNVVN